MKKVLIICDMFPPAFAPRMGYLCKYLQSTGWQPVVLTEFIGDQTFSFLSLGNTPVTYINYYTAPTHFLRKLQWLCIFILDFCFGYKNYRMYKETKKIIKKESFDLVLCSTYRTFPLSVARKVSCKYNLPLVVDLRDIIEQYIGTEFIAHKIPSFLGINKVIASLFKRKSIRTRNRTLRKADCVTTISPWHVDFLKQFNPNTKLIYNGFDPELFYPEQIQTKQFIITYTGRLLSTAMRNPDLFLKALNKLEKEGFLSPEKCRIHWYVDNKSEEIIKREAKRTGTSSFMDYKGYVPANEIPKILNSSSILLLLTNKASGKGPKGIMTTKLFESFAVEKPILCVHRDGSYLTECIEKANAGLAAENVEEVCLFLKHYYTQWEKQSYTSIQVNKNVIETFSRKKQAKQFAHIFEQVTQQTQIHG